MGQRLVSYKALRVWRALKRHPMAGCAEIADRLGWTISVTSRHLGLLKAQGCALMFGQSHASTWTATAKVPVRGESSARIDALRPYQQFAMARLAKANLAKGHKLKPPPQPKPAIALEQYWPMQYVDVRIGQDDS